VLINSCKWPIFAWKVEICHEKSEFCIKLPDKNQNVSQICPENRNFWEIFLENRNFLWNCLKIEILPKCALKKIDFLCKIAWKNRNFWEIFLENRNILGHCLKTEILRKFNLKHRHFLWNYLKKPKIFSEIWPEKLIFFCEIAWKNLNFVEIFFKNRNFFTRVHDPQISNQIDAAVSPRIFPPGLYPPEKNVNNFS